MTNKKDHKAWFIADSQKCAQTLYVRYDNSQEIWSTHFTNSKYVTLDKPIIFEVGDTKWGNEDYIRQWDFLPNSTGIPLVNEKALGVLEELGSGQFQPVPTELHMPDRSIITDYILINTLIELQSIDFEKSVKSVDRRTGKEKEDDYDVLYHHRYIMDNIILARSNYWGLSLYGSEVLRKRVKQEKLRGLVFRDTYAARHVFIEE